MGLAALVANFSQVPAGTYVVTANYSGDTYNEPVQATQTITLNQAATVTTLAGTATITASSPGSYEITVARPNLSGTATGTVTLLFGATSVGTATLSGGTATITVPSSALAAGTLSSHLQILWGCQ